MDHEEAPLANYRAKLEEIFLSIQSQLPDISIDTDSEPGDDERGPEPATLDGAQIAFQYTDQQLSLLPLFPITADVQSQEDERLAVDAQEEWLSDSSCDSAASGEAEQHMLSMDRLDTIDLDGILSRLDDGGQTGPPRPLIDCWFRDFVGDSGEELQRKVDSNRETMRRLAQLAGLNASAVDLDSGALLQPSLSVSGSSVQDGVRRDCASPAVSESLSDESDEDLLWHEQRRKMLRCRQASENR